MAELEGGISIESVAIPGGNKSLLGLLYSVVADSLKEDNVCSLIKTVKSREDVITLADFISEVRPDLAEIAEDCADNVLTAWTG